MGSVLCWVCTSLYIHVTVAKLHMIIRWLAWTCDAIDFFSVSLSIDRLERQFNRSAHDIVRYFKRSLITIDDLAQTTSITLTLLFRSVGAVRLSLTPAHISLMLTSF